jgi:hypothetical protein
MKVSGRVSLGGRRPDMVNADIVTRTGASNSCMLVGQGQVAERELPYSIHSLIQYILYVQYNSVCTGQ